VSAPTEIAASPMAEAEAKVQPTAAVQPEVNLQPTVPVADGGSQLLLSDTLSQPPAPEPRQAAQPAEVAADVAVAPSEPAADPVPAPSVAVSAGPAEEPAPAVAVAVVSRDAPVAVGPEVGPLTEARLAATRDWLQSANDRHFSIQLLLTDFARRANLEKFLLERQAAGEVEDYFVFETRIRSNVWFGVLYKEYPSFGAARDALEELPEEFRYHQPFIRNVSDIATLG